MRRLLPLLAVAALAWGCDTSDLSDAERIVGRWEASSVNVIIGGALPLPVLTFGQGAAEGDLLIESRGFFEMALAFSGKVVIPNTDVTVDLPQRVDLEGTYTLDEGSRTITVSRSGRSTALRYDLSPSLTGAESLQFVATSAQELVALLDLEVEDAEAVFRVASDVSLEFRRPTP